MFLIIDFQKLLFFELTLIISPIQQFSAFKEPVGVSDVGSVAEFIDEGLGIVVSVFANFGNVYEIVRGQHITSCRIYITMPCTLDCLVALEAARRFSASRLFLCDIAEEAVLDFLSLLHT